VRRSASIRIAWKFGSPNVEQCLARAQLGFVEVMRELVRDRGVSPLIVRATTTAASPTRRVRDRDRCIGVVRDMSSVRALDGTPTPADPQCIAASREMM